jgi:hypothetical protein
MDSIIKKSKPLLLSPFFLLLLFSALFFARPLLTGSGISPSDMIYIFDNYEYLAEEDYKPSNELLSDQTTQFEVWKDYAREELRAGRIPYEIPYQGGGAPLIGNDQSAVFFPTNIMYYVLPINLATTLGVILRLAFAAIGMFLFLRELKIQKWLSFIGGIAFAYVGFNVVWLNHPHANVSIFLPWLFWVTHMLTKSEINKKGYIKYGVILALLITLQFLGGHVETSFHICFATGLYFLFRLYKLYETKLPPKENFKELFKRGMIYFISIMVGLLFAMIQLWPFLDYLKDSYALYTRSSSHENPYGQPYAAIPTWFLPNIYGNPKDDIYTQFFPSVSLENGFELAPATTNFNESVQGYAGFIFILLAPFALLIKKRRKLSLFLVGTNVFILLMTLMVWPVFDLVTKLPLFDLSANHRLLLIFGMINIILGCIVIEGIIENRKRIVDRFKILNKKYLYILPGVLAVGGVVIIALSYPSLGLIDSSIGRFIEDRDFAEKAGVMVSYSLTYLGSFLILFSAALTLILLFLQEKISKKHFLMGLFVVVAIDIFLYAYEYNPTLDLNSRFPVTPGIEYLQENTDEEKILFVGFTMPPNIPTAYKLYDLRNYDAMQVKEHKKNFQEAFQPNGSWETIDYLPSIEGVKESNEKYGFDVKYIAVGRASELGDRASEHYGERVVYEGEDFIIVLVD